MILISVTVLKFLILISFSSFSRAAKLQQISKTGIRESEDANIIDVGLNGMENKLDIKSCRCVKMFERCDVEMLEDTVIKEEGKACPSKQRYCCQRIEVPMDATLTEDDSSHLLDLHNTILRDEISDGDKHETAPSGASILATNFGKFLNFLSTGFRFFTNVFS